MSTPETAREQIARVELMAVDSLTWDLSPNDQAALRTVLRQRADVLAALKAMEDTAMRLGLSREHGDKAWADALLAHFAAIEQARAAIAKADGKGQAA